MVGLPSFVVCLVTLVVVGKAVKKAGPYELKIYQLQTCDDEGTGQVHFDNKMQYAGGGKHVYNSPFRFQLPIDENFEMNADVQSWSSQGWRPRAFTWVSKGCKQLDKVMGSFLRGFYKSAGVEVKDCPFPAGNYTSNNWVIQFKLDGVPTVPYNKYKAVLTFTYKAAKIGCINIFMDAVPLMKKEDSTQT